MKRQKILLGGALTRLRARLLSMGWEKWQYQAAILKAEKHAILGLWLDPFAAPYASLTGACRHTAEASESISYIDSESRN